MKSRIFGSFLDLAGWKTEGQAPQSPRFVLVAAPHTSNWDLVYLLAHSRRLGVRVSWMGKKTIFRRPFGGLMRRLGGIAVDRSRRMNLVEQMAAEFTERETLALTVPAEGTRSYASHWRSGFYHIAREAEVPVVLGFLDYKRKVGGLGPEIWLTGDKARDMDVIRTFYADKVGRFPDQFAPPLLKDE